MVLEIADMQIKPGLEHEFEQKVASSLPIFQKAPGFVRLALHKGVENPGRYRMLLEWETLEAHTEGFRKSEGIQQWRALVGHCFAEPPQVDHSCCVVAF